MADKLKELIAKRNEAYNKMVSPLPKDAEGAVDPNGGVKLTAEQHEQFLQDKAAVQELDAQIKPLQAAAELAPEKIVATIADGKGISVDEGMHNREKEQEALYAFFRNDYHGLNEEQREILAIEKGDDAKGGYTVPETLSMEIRTAVRNESVMRLAGTVETSRTGRKYKLEYIDDTANTGQTRAENEASETQDITFSAPRELDYFRLESGEVPITNDWLEDTETADAIGTIQMLLRERLSAREEKVWTEATPNTGDDADIHGIIPDAYKGATSAQTTLAFADFVNLFTAVKQKHRRMGTWMFPSSVLGSMIKLTASAAGVLLWMPNSNVASPYPGTFLGRNYLENESMDAIAPGKNVVMFGNFKWFRIRDVANSLSLIRLEGDDYKRKNAFGLILRERSGARLWGKADAFSPVHYLQMKT